MPENVGQPSGSTGLEQEIAQIEQDLASKRAMFELQKQAGTIEEVPHEKEALREVVGEKMSQAVSDGSSQANSQQSITPPPVIEPPSYLSSELKEKVQELINIAFNQSPSSAIKQARATNNAALIDAFHDALVDELYNYLIERGKLQKI